MKRYWWVGVCLALGSGCTDKNDIGYDRLVFGVVPSRLQAELESDYGPLCRYLSAHLSVPVEIKVSHTYGELGQLINEGEVQLALLSPLAYVQAKRLSPGPTLIAIPIVDGAASYPAFIVTHKGSGIKSIADLAGKRFGFVERGSTSGYLYPLAYLLSLGYDPETFFSEVVFAGNHTRVKEMIELGEIDAGATFDLRGKPFRVLAQTGRIPSETICAAPDLPAPLTQRVQKLLLDADRTEDGRKFLADSYMSAFATTDDRRYDEVRRALRLVEASERR